MSAKPTARAAGIGILAAGLLSCGLVAAVAQPANDRIPEMVAAIFADLPEGSSAVVFKDAPRRHYLAFYVSTYADIKELRAYRVTFRNVLEFGDLETVDELLASGNHAEAFDGLISMMLIELGSQYVSDVNLDGIRDEEVAVGSGHLRDRFHREQFASHADAEAAYLTWLSSAVELAGGG